MLVRSPENPRKTVTKRIVGMEGDTVTFLVDPMNSDRCRTMVVCEISILIDFDIADDSLFKFMHIVVEHIAIVVSVAKHSYCFGAYCYCCFSC